MSDCESVSKEVGKQPEERDSADFSEGFDDENRKTEIPDEDKNSDSNRMMFQTIVKLHKKRRVTLTNQTKFLSFAQNI